MYGRTQVRGTLVTTYPKMTKLTPENMFLLVNLLKVTFFIRDNPKCKAGHPNLIPYGLNFKKMLPK